jgi:hypothetical protein
VFNENCEKLSNAAAVAFHMVVAKTLYVTKRARPVFLTTRVRAPNTDDWEKLCHLMGYLRGDQDHSLIFSGENARVLMWYVDAASVVHPT